MHSLTLDLMKRFSFLLAMSLSLQPWAQTDCGYQPDVDPDWAIGVTDILALLGLFGEVDSDQDYIWDSEDLCTDVEACNYTANPTEECLYEDNFGICGGDGVLPELLIGSWQFSTAAGAVKVGPSPYSDEWFSSAVNGLQNAQYDDVYTFHADGSFTSDYNGLIIDAFLDYSEQVYTCGGADLTFTPGAGSSGEDAFTLGAIGGACSCLHGHQRWYDLRHRGVVLNDLGHPTVTTLLANKQAVISYTFHASMTALVWSMRKVPGRGQLPWHDLGWSDEFDGSTINSNNWTYDLGASGWGNNEWQNYTSSPNNSSVADGYLTITARQEGGGYTSARMKSVDLQEFQYGRIDFRAKLPEGQGIWPALWMLGSNFPEGGWPQCGEIDVMELIGHQPAPFMARPTGAAAGMHQYNGGQISLPGGAKFSEAFHLFSIVWEANNITWYMDDQPYFSINSAQMNGQPYPFNASFFFIMNIAVGGNWPGTWTPRPNFPNHGGRLRKGVPAVTAHVAL